MRVFVLGTGRCGTVTISRAFAHATNYTVAHESRIDRLDGRLDYPDNHIEVDGRLSWFVGSLLKRYPDAMYIHLYRDVEETVESYVSHRAGKGAMLPAFANGIVQGGPDFDREAASRLCIETVHDNVRLLALCDAEFFNANLADLHNDFPALWVMARCEGDLDAAVAELTIRHNARDMR